MAITIIIHSCTPATGHSLEYSLGNTLFQAAIFSEGGGGYACTLKLVQIYRKLVSYT